MNHPAQGFTLGRLKPLPWPPDFGTVVIAGQLDEVALHDHRLFANEVRRRQVLRASGGKPSEP